MVTNRRIRALMVFIMTFMFSVVSSAQFMRMSPEDRAKALKDSLSLDTTQTKKVTAIYKESQEQMSKAFETSAGDREAMRATMMDLAKKTDDKIKGVLTDTQKKKYEQMIKNRPARGMRRMTN